MKKFIFTFLLISLLSCSDDGTDTPQTPVCDAPTGMSTSDETANSVSLNWNANGNSFELEFGESGFEFGSGEGQTIFTSSNQKIISNLTANTTYQYYIRTNCSNDNFSNWEGPYNATTSHGDCPNATDVYEYTITDTTAYIVWNYPSNSIETPTSWIVEYGESGFTLGNGNSVTTSNLDYALDNLIQSTEYDYYITSVCNTFNGNTTGPYSFTTEATCQKPSDLDSYNIEPCSFDAYWQSNNENAWEIEYGEPGFTLGTGNIINTSNTNYSITGVAANTTYEIYVRANCGSDGYSEYSDTLVVTTGTSDKYLGTYYYESVTNTAFGLPAFGDPYNVQIIEDSANVRSINVSYVGTSNFDFKFELGCNGEINVLPSTTHTVCVTGAASIILGPASNTQSYDMNNDYVLEFTFWELYQGTGDCGLSDSPVTIKFTKQ